MFFEISCEKRTIFGFSLCDMYDVRVLNCKKKKTKIISMKCCYYSTECKSLRLELVGKNCTWNIDSLIFVSFSCCNERVYNWRIPKIQTGIVFYAHRKYMILIKYETYTEPKRWNWIGITTQKNEIKTKTLTYAAQMHLFNVSPCFNDDVRKDFI